MTNDETLRPKRSKLTIILIVILGTIFYILPSFLIFGSFIYELCNHTQFVTENNNIIINDGKLTIKNLEANYNPERQEYIITGSIDESPKNYDLYLEFELYNENDYIIGTTSISLSLAQDSSHL